VPVDVLNKELYIPKEALPAQPHTVSVNDEQKNPVSPRLCPGLRCVRLSGTKSDCACTCLSWSSVVSYSKSFAISKRLLYSWSSSCRATTVAKS